jgi:glycosyltransferase involved in cell wall biosynthesis/tetratricopeptide (TPR) repeat protein
VTQELALKARAARMDGKTAESLSLAMAAVKQEESINALLELGYAANETRNWDEAEKAWKRLTELVPERLGPWDRLVTVYLDSNRPAAAISCIEAAKLRFPDFLAFDLIYLRCLDALGRSQEGDDLAAELEGKLEDTPDGARHIITLARRYQTLGRRGRALELFKRAAAVAPDWVDPLVYLARISTVMGEIDDAEAFWQAVLGMPDGDRFKHEISLFRARQAALQKRYEVAIIEFEQALSVGGEDPGILFELFRFVWSHSQVDTEAVFKRLEKAGGDPIPAKIAGAMMATRAGNIDKAHKLYREAYEIDPNDRRARNALGAFLSNNFASKRAVEYWREVVEKFPTDIDPKIMFMRAVKAASGDPTEISRISRSILATSPSQPEALLQLGQAQIRLGHRAEALEILDRGRRIHPENENFWTNLVNEMLNGDKHSDATELCAAAEQAFDRNSPPEALKLARILLAADQKERARQIARTGLDKAPEFAELRTFMIRLLEQMGRLSEAEPLVYAARKAEPDNLELGRLAAKISAFSRALSSYSHKPAKNDLSPECVFPAITRLRAENLQQESRNTVLQVSSSLGPGGAERQVVYTLLGFDTIEHEFESVDLVVRDLSSINYNFFLDVVEHTGRHVDTTEGDPTSRTLRDALAQGLAMPDHIALLEACGDEIAKLAVPLYAQFVTRRPQVVHLWQDFVNVIGGYAAVLAGVPRIVLSGRSTRPDARRRQRRWLQSGYTNLLSLPGVSMLNNSTAGARDYENWLALEDGSIYTIHNGLDIAQMLKNAESVEAGSIRADLGIPDDAPLIGGVMRFSEEKRPSLFIEIAEELCKLDPSAHCVLIGTGPLAPDAAAMVAATGLESRIHLVGAQRPVEPWMATMSCLVLTSRMEGLPNVLIEAQVLGTPVVSARVGGAPEAIDEGKSGLLFSPDETPAAIASMIAGLVKDQERLEAFGRAASDFTRSRFSIEAMARSTAAHYANSGAQKLVGNADKQGRLRTGR